MTKTLSTAICVGMLCIQLAQAKEAEQWARIGNYSLGMHREKAKNVGLKNCNESVLDTVECEPQTPISIGGVVATRARLEFEAKSGRLSKISAGFPKGTYAAVSEALVKEFGTATYDAKDHEAQEWLRGGRGSYWQPMVWHRGKNEIVGIAWQQYSRSGETLVEAEKSAHLRKWWADIKAAKDRNRKTAESYNSR